MHPGRIWLEKEARRLGIPQDLPGREIFIEHIRARHKENDDALIAICGRRGGGKSTTARKYARAFDADFDIKLQCCFSFPAVMEAAESLSPGQCIIWDEPNEGNQARSHATKVNRAQEEFFTISRDRCLIVMPLHIKFRKMDPAQRTYATHFIGKESRGIARVHVRQHGSMYSDENNPSWLQLYRERCSADTEYDEKAYDEKKSLARRGIATRYQDVFQGATHLGGLDDLTQAAKKIAARRKGD